MERHPVIHIAVAGLTSLGALALSALPASQAASRDGDSGAGAVRAWTEKYHDVSVAIADGFMPTDACVPGMGYHFVNPARFDGVLEVSKPEALLYRKDAEGNLLLSGAEWVVVDADQDLATDDDRPSALGRPLEGPMPGHEPGMPIHYDLHAYVWSDNPDGTFATWNPTITCP